MLRHDADPGRAPRPQPAAPRHGLSRRTLLRLALASAAGVGALVPLDALLLEPLWIEVTRLDMPIPGLPRALDGFSIAQLSDLHPLVLRGYSDGQDSPLAPGPPMPRSL